MEELEILYQEMGISPAVYARGEKVLDTLLILGEAETGLIVSRPEVLNNLADEILNNVKKED